jgi:hypothetical protein
VRTVQDKRERAETGKGTVGGGEVYRYGRQGVEK